MRKLISINHVSLDGVMQSPGSAHEDPRAGFTLGGWIVPYWTEAMGRQLVAELAAPFDLLFGRRTYEMLAAYWPHADPNPITDAFNRATKYVATRSQPQLDWAKSEALPGDGVSAVRRLKSGDGPDILLYGSSSFLQQLIAADLVDEYLIRSYPLVLGRGRRLFEAGAPARALRLIDSDISSTGVITSRYRLEGALEAGDFGQAPSEAELSRRRRLAREDSPQAGQAPA